MVVIIGDVKEKSDGWVTVSFNSRTGTPTVPSSVYYRIDCKTTGTVITSLTGLTPASAIEIHISATENRILDQHNDKELRELTVSAYWAGNEEAHNAVGWNVESLEHVS